MFSLLQYASGKILHRRSDMPRLRSGGATRAMTKSCAVCDRDAVGLIVAHGQSRYLCAKHYDDAKAEYGKQVSTARLFPGGEL
jgi:hypothetical protein